MDLNDLFKCKKLITLKICWTILFISIIISLFFIYIVLFLLMWKDFLEIFNDEIGPFIVFYVSILISIFKFTDFFYKNIYKNKRMIKSDNRIVLENISSIKNEKKQFKFLKKIKKYFLYFIRELKEMFIIIFGIFLAVFLICLILNEYSDLVDPLIFLFHSTTRKIMLGIMTGVVAAFVYKIISMKNKIEKIWQGNICLIFIFLFIIFLKTKDIFVLLIFIIYFLSLFIIDIIRNKKNN